MTRRLLGRITRRPGHRPIASTPDEVAAMTAATEPTPAGPVWPRLDVDGLKYLSVFGWRWAWRWQVVAPDGRVIEENEHGTHPEALAVGLAALEAATVRAHELSAGWEKITP